MTFLDRCMDCGQQYEPEYSTDRWCPVCVARRKAPKSSSQHTTVPGVMTLLVRGSS